jgi:hypothetical protein
MTIDFREAARRIRTIGNWMMLIGGSLVFIFLLLVGVESPSSLLQRNLTQDLFGTTEIILPGVAVRLIAWVVDGLAGPSNSETAPPNSAQ